MIIIKEYSSGGVYMGSKSFNTDKSGYAAAYAYIQAIIDRGGRAEGDVGKVYAYFGVWGHRPATGKAFSLAFFYYLWYNEVNYGKEE